jgi:hypothetical protein
MKTLKFKPELMEAVLSGEKTSTWRMFDDKDLQVNDEISLVDHSTGNEFARAMITSVVEKELGQIVDSDFEGHSKYKDQEDMLNHYRVYYGEKVTLETPIKLISFKLK